MSQELKIMAGLQVTLELDVVIIFSQITTYFYFTTSVAHKHFSSTY